jgi:hypothetical protein
MIIPERGDAPIIVDANPGILTLPTATLQTVADATALTEQALADVGADEVVAHIGPPPERLDWRRSAG